MAIVVLLIAAYLGWREFWFITDDAHITFRYISSHRLGWGYAFNPPPFVPVEGYSNFLWMVMLEGIWGWSGVEPPDSSNPLSFLFSLGTLALAFALVARLQLPEPWSRHRFWISAAVVAACLTNGTFLTWMSSGLEEALYIFCVTAWLVCTLWYAESKTLRPLLFANVPGAAAALTRPDGALFGAAAFALVMLAVWREKKLKPLLCAAPLLAVVAHLLWRHSYYGEWVPNTYYAKYDTPWPRSGLRYVLVFVMEYALWAPIALGAYLALRRTARGWVKRATPEVWIAVGALAAHFAYFTLMIGGDHFEYRVYAHTVLILWVGIVAMIAALKVSVPKSIGLFVAMLLVSLPLGWVHHVKTRSLGLEQFTEVAVTRIADSFPWPLSMYVGLYDDTRYWLVRRLVSVRRHEHSEVARQFMSMYPARPEGERVTWKDARAVMPRANPGIAGWQLPQVAIIDTLGLTDRVVGRNRATSEQEGGVHKMAHARVPPNGYVDCFLPNAVPTDKGLVITLRPEPLTDERIIECEAKFAPPLDMP